MAQTAGFEMFGEIDAYTTPGCEDQIRKWLASGGLPTIDMSAVTFVDSTALGVLIEARSKLGRDRLLLAAPQPETRRTLQVSGLDRHLPVHDSVDGALAAGA